MEEIRERRAEIEGTRYPGYVKCALLGILTAVMCAVLCGLDTLGDLVIYAKSKKEFLAKDLGIEDISSKAIFSRVLSAVDGKAIRSTEKAGNPHSALQILSAYVTSGGVVLGQETMKKRTKSLFSRKCSPIWTSNTRYLPLTLCTASGKPAAESCKARAIICLALGPFEKCQHAQSAGLFPPYFADFL